jgi:orotidine-5'-phosphate decarboxylase
MPSNANRVIFALDAPDWESARPLAEELAGEVGYFKVGLELFLSEGPAVVDKLRAAAGKGTGLFLDLKLHDIPATAGRAMSRLDGLGADLVTVHASGGPAMIEAVKKAAGPARVLAVTVLTSIDPADCRELAPEYRGPGALVEYRAAEALAAGADGLVAGGSEAATLRARFGPDPLLVVPGIRPAWSAVQGDDQRRIVTPADAVAKGADLIVVGRPIRDAADRAAAARRTVEEIRAASGRLKRPGEKK